MVDLGSVSKKSFCNERKYREELDVEYHICFVSWRCRLGKTLPAYSVAWIAGNVSQAAAATTAEGASGAAFSAAERAYHDCSLTNLDAIVRDGLAPWALGTADPLNPSEQE